MPAHSNPDLDEPVKIPLDPETAMRALLQVPSHKPPRTTSNMLSAKEEARAADGALRNLFILMEAYTKGNEADAIREGIWACGQIARRLSERTTP